jgi:hypothetical protein
MKPSRKFNWSYCAHESTQKLRPLFKTQGEALLSDYHEFQTNVVKFFAGIPTLVFQKEATKKQLAYS